MCIHDTGIKDIYDNIPFLFTDFFVGYARNNKVYIHILVNIHIYIYPAHIT